MEPSSSPRRAMFPRRSSGTCTSIRYTGRRNTWRCDNVVHTVNRVVHVVTLFVFVLDKYQLSRNCHHVPGVPTCGAIGADGGSTLGPVGIELSLGSERNGRKIEMGRSRGRSGVDRT